MIIYTVATRGHSVPEPHYVNLNCEYVAFTDYDDVPAPYQAVRVEPRHHSAYLTVKWYRTHAHTLFPEHDTSLYHDSGLRVRGDVDALAQHALRDHHQAFYQHYERDCIYTEAKAVKNGGMNKNGVDRHMKHLREQGYPAGQGLVCGGVQIRRHHEPEVIALHEELWNCLQVGPVRDQLHINYLFWKRGATYYAVQDYLLNCEHFIARNLE